MKISIDKDVPGYKTATNKARLNPPIHRQLWMNCEQDWIALKERHWTWSWGTKRESFWDLDSLRPAWVCVYHAIKNLRPLHNSDSGSIRRTRPYNPQTRENHKCLPPGRLNLSTCKQNQWINESIAVGLTIYWNLSRSKSIFVFAYSEKNLISSIHVNRSLWYPAAFRSTICCSKKAAMALSNCCSLVGASFPPWASLYSKAFVFWSCLELRHCSAVRDVPASLTNLSGPVAKRN